MPGKARISFEADTQKAISSMSRQVLKQDEMIAKLKEQNREARNAAQGGDRLASSFDGVVSKIAGFVSLAGAIGGVTKALSELRAARTGAAEGLLTEEQALKQLVQISGGSSQRFQELRKMGMQISQTFGIERAEALDLVFQGKSGGFSDQEVLSSGRFKRFAAGISPLIGGVVGLRGAFGQQAAGGTPDSIVNALLAGAEFSKVNVERLGGAILSPAQSVRALGGTAEETIAAVAVAARALKSEEVGATVVSRIADIMRRDERFQGGGLVGGIRKLAGFSQEERNEIVGENVRARRGASVLILNLAELEMTLSAVNTAIERTGTPESRINQALGITSTQSPLREIEIARGARISKESTQRELFVDELLGEATIQATEEELDRRETDPIVRFLTLKRLRLAQFFGASSASLGSTSRRALFGLTEAQDRIGNAEAEAFSDGIMSVKDSIDTQTDVVRKLTPAGPGRIKANAAIE